jgi:hypothetical protein
MFWRLIGYWQLNYQCFLKRFRGYVMSKKIIQTAVIIFLFGFIKTGFSCSEADVPAFPDPKKAVLAEMIKAQKDVKKYLSDSEGFLKCVTNDRRYDAVVDNMHQVAERFNSVRKEYMERKKI